MAPLKEVSVTEITDRARDAAKAALATREKYRWHVNKGDPERKADIAAALEGLDRAMKPVRSEIGRLPWHPRSAHEEQMLRSVSRRCQYERKQLKKMQ